MVKCSKQENIVRYLNRQKAWKFLNQWVEGKGNSNFIPIPANNTTWTIEVDNDMAVILHHL